ncbi:hypothetical protein Kisp01_35810 [Kineosporia sp. NBRC 101677]|nr:hypothetical protein Kisp01_35810 [Kineosporia sp. NBRC 101677]
MPSASAEKALTRPSGARPRRRLNATKLPGVAITDTPPAIASEVSLWRSAWAARWMATSELEAEVSTVRAGPFRPRV